MNLPRLTALTIAATITAVATHAGVTLTYPASTASPQPLLIDAPAATGINGGIHVVPRTDGLRITYTSSAAVKWSRYSTLGAAYAEEVTPSGHDATSSWLDSPSGDTGYVIEPQGQAPIYLWVTDYSAHEFTPGTLTLAPEQECGRVALDCTATADEITYYSITGRRNTLARDITLTYLTLTWDDDAQTYAQTTATIPLPYLTPTLHADAPLCTTPFTLTGDRFLTAWGKETTCTSDHFAPRSLTAHTETIADNTTADNEISTSQPGALGGSAPLTVTFSAQVTDAAIFHEWQIARTPDFDDVTLRASELDFTHTFTEQGTLYVRLYCANADATCDYYSPTYEITIGESMLKCPNAFTPYNQDGVNDIWKVTYSSIIQFECHIFNRNGRKITSFTDPSQGWDGRYGGKFVPAGAYYYVIKARSSDGKTYNLSGDINILDYK